MDKQEVYQKLEEIKEAIRKRTYIVMYEAPKNMKCRDCGDGTLTCDIYKARSVDDYGDTMVYIADEIFFCHLGDGRIDSYFFFTIEKLFSPDEAQRIIDQVSEWFRGVDDFLSGVFTEPACQVIAFERMFDSYIFEYTCHDYHIDERGKRKKEGEAVSIEDVAVSTVSFEGYLYYVVQGDASTDKKLIAVEEGTEPLPGGFYPTVVLTLQYGEVVCVEEHDERYDPSIDLLF